MLKSRCNNEFWISWFLVQKHSSSFLSYWLPYNNLIPLQLPSLRNITLNYFRNVLDPANCGYFCSINYNVLWVFLLSKGKPLHMYLWFHNLIPFQNPLRATQSTKSLASLNSSSLLEPFYHHTNIVSGSGGSVSKTLFFQCRGEGGLQSLVRELKSHMLQGMWEEMLSSESLVNRRSTY